MTPNSTPKRNRIALALAYAGSAFVMTLALVGGMELSAQGVGGGIASHNTRAPVSVDAGRIDVQERENRVAFSGNVIVTQADLKVRAPRMLLNYVDEESLELQRITATGGVSIVRGGERATGTSAVYDFNRRIITLAGDVRLDQGENSLSGGRLVIDLDTGLWSVDGKRSNFVGQTPLSGRVRGTFTVPQDDAEVGNED
ncbi:MAG: LptA/OstA family protein [Pseudomonadota bacterium]